MGTVVPLPQLREANMANGDVGNAARQEAANIDAAPRFGKFLDSVVKGTQAFKDEHASENMAKGMNDAISGATRDVMWLHKSNYNAGYSFQQATSKTLEMNAEFNKSVQNMKEGDDVDAMLQNAHAHGEEAINMVAASNMPPKLKERFYEMVLTQRAENAVTVGKRVQKLAEDSEAKTRTALIAKNFQSLIGLDEVNAGQVIQVIEQTNKVLYDGHEQVYKNASEDERMAIVHKANEAALSMAFAQAVQDKRSDRVTLLRQAADAMFVKGLISSDYAVKMHGEANTLEAKVIDEIEAIASTDLDSKLATIQLNGSFSQSEYDNLMGELSKDTSLTVPTRERLRRETTSLFVSMNKKQDTEIDPLAYDTRAEADLNGVSDEKYTHAQFKRFLDQSNGDWKAAAANYYQHALKQGDGKGIAYAGGILLDGIKGYIQLEDKQLANNPQARQQTEYFEVFKSMYKNASPLARRQLLDGVDEKTANLIALGLENGIEDMETLRQLSTKKLDQVDKESYKRYVESQTSSTMDIGRAYYVIPTNAGGMGKGYLDNKNKEFLANLYKGIQNEDGWEVDYLIKKQLLPSSAGIFNSWKRNGGLRESAAGAWTAYTYKGAQEYNKLHNAYGVTDDNVKGALGEWQSTLAKNYKVSPANVMITSTKDGQHFQFYVMKNGEQLNASDMRNATNGSFVPMEAVFQEAARHKRLNTATVAAKTSKSGATRDNHLVGRRYSVYSSDTKTKQNVNLTSGYARAFNNNSNMTAAIYNHLYKSEGFTSKVKYHKDASGKVTNSTIGMGININAQTPDMQRKFMAAQGNPQAIVSLTGEHMVNFFKETKFNDSLKRLNIPQDTLNPKAIAGATLVADASWHGHYQAATGHTANGRSFTGYLKYMKADSYREGLAGLRNSLPYIKSGAERKRSMEVLLRQYYDYRGVK